MPSNYYAEKKVAYGLLADQTQKHNNKIIYPPNSSVVIISLSAEKEKMRIFNQLCGEDRDLSGYKVQCLRYRG